MFTHIDLFSGIGGFRLAVEYNKGCCIGYSEIDQNAIKTYTLNFTNSSKEYNFGDITTIKELPYCDLLTAGVPCQSWSIAGKNLGFDDTRGKLWDNTLYLLNQSKPKAFIFENVKGLVDPRNKEAFNYILSKIKECGYSANYYILNSCNYGIPQNRIRVYIIGFKQKEFCDSFHLPQIVKTPNLSYFLDYPSFHSIKSSLTHITDIYDTINNNNNQNNNNRFSISTNQNGFNDYFLFNDIRNGDTTIHSWDIIPTSDREKQICMLLLNNRRKTRYGNRDGNPLTLSDFQELDSSITQTELNELVLKGILRVKERDKNKSVISTDTNTDNEDILYDFRQSKISTGLFGVNRIFLPSSSLFATLTANDANDYVTDLNIESNNLNEYKTMFLNNVYHKHRYRKITKTEACKIQGFPDSFILPEKRNQWMKQIGNSISVPVVSLLVKQIIKTGVFL